MKDYPALKLYIGGEWRQADGQPVINPADESILGTVPHVGRNDLDDALAAAEQGFKVWSRTAPAKRAEIILKAAALMRERVETMAVAMTLEQGKPIAQSRLDRVVLVSDAAILGAQAALWETLRIVAEPGAAAPLAALLSGAYVPSPGERVGVLVSGGNMVGVTFGPGAHT